MKRRKKGHIRLDRLRPFYNGGVAQLSVGEQPDGTKLVRRELLPKYIFHWRMHRGFIKGTVLRERLTPHRNIVFSVERGHERLRPYEIIEYVPGKNLRELAGKEKEYVRDHALEIIRQIANGLAHMHHKQVLHLDVKAENVLIDCSDREKPIAKLTDFDLSCDFHCHHNQSRAGTRNYMAPEELQKGDVSVSTDIFAFGVLAYYVVTGKMPFNMQKGAEIRGSQLDEAFIVVPAIKHNPDLMPKLNQMIMKCLERDPNKRFPSMSYLHQELGHV